MGVRFNKHEDMIFQPSSTSYDTTTTCYKHKVVVTGLVIWFVVSAISSVIGFLVVQHLRIRALDKLSGGIQDDEEEETSDMEKSNEEKDEPDVEALLLEDKFHWQRCYLTFFWVLVSGLIVLTVTGLALDGSREVSTAVYWSMYSIGPIVMLLYLTFLHIGGTVLK